MRTFLVGNTAHIGLLGGPLDGREVVVPLSDLEVGVVCVFPVWSCCGAPWDGRLESLMRDCKHARYICDEFLALRFDGYEEVPKAMGAGVDGG